LAARHRAAKSIKRRKNMKKAILIMAVAVPLLAACGGNKCESEPIVAENHKLIVPPNFGQMPK